MALVIVFQFAVSGQAVRLKVMAPTPRKPNRLRPGDVIGLIAPASPPRSRERVEAGVRYLERLGYRVKPGRHLDAEHGYLAGTDAQRVEDLNTMLRDPQVRAIFALRGGYGTPRILPYVDYAASRRDPKIVVGSSDLTALQLALWRRAGLVTFSGPMVATDFGDNPDPYTEEQFWPLITSARIRSWLRQPKDRPLRGVRAGHAEGPLLGGNLSLVTSSLGTTYSPRYQGAVLVLEEVGEPWHRVDRMLTQLRNAGVLGSVAGLIFGMFTGCHPIDPKQPHLTRQQIIREVVASSDVPIIDGFQYGHESQKLTIAFGIRAQLDAVRGRVQMLEAAVV
jgi:muramoyltetrapeptide carboxypeptidase